MWPAIQDPGVRWRVAGLGAAAVLFAAGVAAWSIGFSFPGLARVAPRLVAPEEALDLGQGEPGEELRGALRLTNAGRAVLHIDRVEAGCACAGHALSRADVPPGEQAELRISARIRAEGQHLSFPVQIFSNDPAAPVTVCLVTADAGPPALRTDPPALDFGEVAVGASPARRLHVVKPDSHPWPQDEPVTTEAARGQVRFTTAPSKPGATEEGLVIEVRPCADLPLGRFSDTVTLRPAGSGRSVTVPVQGSVVPPLVASPTTLYFGDVERRSGPLTRNLLLRRTNGKPLPPLAKSSGPPGVRVEELAAKGTPPPDAPRRLRVTLDPAAVIQDIRDGKLTLWLQDEAEPVTVGLMIFLSRQTAQARP